MAQDGEFADVWERTEGKLPQPMVDCLVMLAAGKTVPQIASLMSKSEPAIAQMIADTCSRLRARNSVHAINIALRRGLI